MPKRIIVFLSTLLVIYFGVSIFFTNHLFFGTEINGINVSGKTVTVVKAQMTSDLQAYTLNLKYQDGRNEQINGGDIYKANGSHGCVNSPYTLVQTIYNNIDVGTPIVCYR